MKYYYVLFAVSLLCFSNCSTHKMLKTSAHNQIEMLKNNALLVRLNGQHNKIEALKKVGKLKEAEQVLAMAAEENQKTIDAFIKYYTFSKVYFFDSGESVKLKAKQYNAVKLFDGAHNIVTDPSFIKAGYLVASFASVYQDQQYYQDENNVKYAVYGTESMPALVIMDGDYIQLSKPFPFRVISNLSDKRYQVKSVIRLNKDLNKYYSRYERKKSRKNRSGGK